MPHPQRATFGEPIMGTADWQVGVFPKARVSLWNSGKVAQFVID
jgi:hypothetical protein